jgi:hypothetical protein
MGNLRVVVREAGSTIGGKCRSEGRRGMRLAAEKA